MSVMKVVSPATIKLILLPILLSCILSAGLIGATLAQTSEPTVTVSDATLEPDETTEVDIRLTEAPNGLAGYNLTLSIADTLTGEFTTAEYGSGFEITEEPRYTDLNSSVQLRAIDVQNPPGPNASDVLLATVTVKGEKQGETSLTVDVTRMDDDDGGKVNPSIEPGTLTVEAENETPTPTSTPTSTATPTPTPTPTPTSTATPTPTSQPESPVGGQSEEETESAGTRSTESESTPEAELTESEETQEAQTTETIPVTDTQPDASGTNVEIEADSPVEKITFSESADTSTASIKISETDEPAPAVETELREEIAQSTETTAVSESTAVRSLVEISPSADSLETSSATIQLQIDRNEITDPDEVIVAHRLAEDNWEVLPTSTVETTDSAVTVEVTVESFSLFAIAETGVEQVTTQSQATSNSEETAASIETPAEDNAISLRSIVAGASIGIIIILLTVWRLTNSE